MNTEVYVYIQFFNENNEVDFNDLDPNKEYIINPENPNDTGNDTGLSIIHKLCLFPEKLQAYIHHLAQIRKLGNKSINSITTKHHYTPLMMACINNVKESVELLLQYGAKLNLQTNVYNNTALNLICTDDKYIEIVKLLLQSKSINVNIQNNVRNSPLLYACFLFKTNNIKIFKLLLTHKDIDVNIVNNDRFNAQLLCMKYDRKEHFELLLTHDKIDVNHTLSMLPLYTEYCITTYLPLLLNHPSLNIDKRNLLRLGCENGDIECVKMIVKMLLNHPQINNNLKYISKAFPYITKELYPLFKPYISYDEKIELLPSIIKTLVILDLHKETKLLKKLNNFDYNTILIHEMKNTIS